MITHDVYFGSDGEATKALYAKLEQHGAIGVIAMNLFRACKCSARAKVYRGGIRGKGSYRAMAYDRKEWSIRNLVEALSKHAELGIKWGWRRDPAQEFHDWVLYVDAPGAGQISFHSAQRGIGPDYDLPWDAAEPSDRRVIRFIDSVLGLAAPENEAMLVAVNAEKD